MTVLYSPASGPTRPHAVSSLFFATFAQQGLSESARINGAKSHGAIMPQSRANSSMIAAGHGITAKTLILRDENQDYFLEIMHAYFEYLKPSNRVEVDLISQMAAARWRLCRIWRHEIAILDLEMDAQAPDFEKRFATLVDKLKSSLPAYVLMYTGAFPSPKCQMTTPIWENCQNDPTEPPKPSLNGENQHLIGEPTEDA
jgi:hypothetical protein